MYPRDQSSESESTGEDRLSERVHIESPRVQEELTSLSGVLGRKWNLVIIERLLANGPMGFSDMLDAIDGISSKVLSESLDDLEDVDFVARNIVSERPFRVEYAVTQQADVVEPLITKVRRGTLQMT